MLPNTISRKRIFNNRILKNAHFNKLFGLVNYKKSNIVNNLNYLEMNKYRLILAQRNMQIFPKLFLMELDISNGTENFLRIKKRKITMPAAKCVY